MRTLSMTVRAPAVGVAARRVNPSARPTPSSALRSSVVVRAAKDDASEKMDEAKENAQNLGEKLKEGYENFKKAAWDEPVQGIAESTAAGVQAAKENVVEGTAKQTREGFQSAAKVVKEDTEALREGGPAAMADRVKRRVQKEDEKGL